MPAERNRSSLKRLRPATATVVTPACAAACATPTGALPANDCSSNEPSPVITRSAPTSARSKSNQSSSNSIPGRSSAFSRARAAKPVPPAAPAPARVPRSVPVASATRLAHTARARSSWATSAGLAPFWGPKTAAAPRGPSRGLSTSLATTIRTSPSFCLSAASSRLSGPPMRRRLAEDRGPVHRAAGRRVPAPCQLPRRWRHSRRYRARCRSRRG